MWIFKQMQKCGKILLSTWQYNKMTSLPSRYQGAYGKVLLAGPPAPLPALPGVTLGQGGPPVSAAGEGGETDSYQGKGLLGSGPPLMELTLP